jgi:cell fate (sporulation/competence/biofilm development) regulator YlbF (YheA/YmcA/DUF963 family)
MREDIRNPQAYQDAVARRIKANASTTRRRKLEAAVASDSPEFRADADAKERLLKDVKANAMYEALDPIRTAYQNTHSTVRAQMIADVVAYITRS